MQFELFLASVARFARDFKSNCWQGTTAVFFDREACLNFQWVWLRRSRASDYSRLITARAELAAQSAIRS